MERNEKFQKAVRDKKEAKTAIEDLKEKLKQAQNERENLYSKLNLELGDKDSLKKLCSDLSQYKKVKKKLENTRHVRNREKRKLKESNQFKKSLLEKDMAELKTLKKELVQKDKKYDEVKTEIDQIEARIEDARESSNIEKALARKERSLNELKFELDQDYKKMTGKVIADFIKNINSVANRPQVFERARKLFAIITRGNYKLEIKNSNPPSFTAIDTKSGRGKTLDELSSGTRIQLLLAVRMAFVEREEGLILPLYFDETLANADDNKACEIIKSIIELSQKGRQCFYFTAQKDEVKKWISVLKEESQIQSNIINLAKKQNPDSSITLPDITKLIPDNNEIAVSGDDMSIPDFNPRQGAETAHLWYLVEDEKLLKHFLKAGIKKWGQLKTLLKTDKKDFIPAEKTDKVQEIKELGSCLEEFVESWKVGRGQPVDRSVLKKTDAVTDNFIDEVSNLAQKVNGNSEKIIKELRAGAVSNFLTRKIDQLEEYFKENGYIDSTDILTDEEIHARMISVFSSDNTENVGGKIKRLWKRIKTR